VLDEERHVLVVDEEAILDVRNLDVAMWGQESACARGDVDDPSVGPGAAWVGTPRRSGEVAEFEGQQPQRVGQTEDPKLALPCSRDGLTGCIEVGASDRDARLGDAAIANEWGNVGQMK
jgi:hypothetical protein